MTYSDIIATASFFSAIVGIFLVVRQLNLSRKGQNEEHLRRKKEATLEAFHLIRDDLRVQDDLVREYLCLDYNEKMTEKDVERVLSNDDVRTSLRTTLHYVSRFATGVKHDIYDIDTLNDLNGQFFILMYNRYDPYVKMIQKKTPQFYTNHQDFINKLITIDQ